MYKALTKKNVASGLSLITLSIFAILVLIMPIISFAQDIDGDPIDSTDSQSNVQPTKIYNPLGDKNIDIPGLIKNVLINAIKIFIPVVALAIIYCGFLFVFAMGNPEKLKKAKDALLYTLIGAAILLGAWAIATLIVNTVQGLG